MPVCRDPQHERFARELVEQYLMVPPPKQPQLEAYKRAGFAPHRGNCYRLARRKEVVARVAELMDEAREYLDIRAVKALVRVDRIADAKLPDYYGEDGKALALKDLPPRLAEALAEVEYHDDGTIKRIKLHDKGQANTLILKYLGGLPEEEKPQAQVNIWNVLSPEDQRVLADALEALARRQAGAGAGAAPALEPVAEGT
jgi:Terminase small subunit